MAKPNRIILVRHGESEGNIDRAVYSRIADHKVELTENGKKQAVKVGEEISYNVSNPLTNNLGVYISPYKRTRETWKWIKYGIKQTFPIKIAWEKEDPRIREQEWISPPYHDLFDKEVIDDIFEHREFDRFWFRMPYGESGADVYDRITTFLDTMHRDFQKKDSPENILIITHGITLRIFLMRWFHWTTEEFNAYKNPKNCQHIIMELQNNSKYRITKGLDPR